MEIPEDGKVEISGSVDVPSFSLPVSWSGLPYLESTGQCQLNDAGLAGWSPAGFDREVVPT